ncbi:MAG: glycoside hydrolase family 97 protein [Cyclobacteriaceae bacterium]
MISKNFVYLIIYLLFSVVTYAEEYTLQSPDNLLKINLLIDKHISFKAFYQNELLFETHDISLHLKNGEILGKSPTVIRSSNAEVNELIHPVIKEKKSEIKNHCNELTLWFQGNFGLFFRVYDHGIAYRFFTEKEAAITIVHENLEVQNMENDSVWFQSSKTFNSSYETPYEKERTGKISDGKLCNLPMLIMKENGQRILIAESDLTSYPGMWMRATGKEKFISTHPKYPETYIENKNLYAYHQVKTTTDFIAQTNGKRTFPWRIFAFARNDAELLTNDLVYILAPEQKIAETDWIKPGVVAFDWWGRRNIFGVDFKAGVNTETAKYFIDFCSKYGFQYFLFDDGWSPLHDILNPVKELNIEEVSAYAKEKGVDLMLWVHWYGLKKNMEPALDLFHEWDIKGIKVDFMNRDDQEMVDFYEEVASECAKREMVVNFHGAYKPAGLRRAYPNVLTREGLIEFEYNGMNKNDNPIHHNLLPYLRLVTGPMDYIPATMRNATKSNHRIIGDYPMGQGTRAHALALFVILSSPMTMLPDSPSDYYSEEESTVFISEIPVEWDEIKVLHAEIGEHTALARRKGEIWYVAAITNWKDKKMKINLDFLKNKKYKLKYIEDGPNADKRAADYNLKDEIVTKSQTIHINMASGGGWIGRLSPAD